jgi:predicted metal-dependent HD superfamily phosphohydrolase
LTHIGKVDEMLNKYSHLAHSFIALKFAGDGHDVVYVPGSQTNEEDSALFMRGIMTRLGIPHETIAETERLILLTKDHKTSEDDIDGQLLIDADFAILGSDEAAYDAYAQAIWQEYVGSQKVAEEIFRGVRANLIEGWLLQDRIFLVDEIRNELEPIARHNLERELITLRSR